MSKESDTSRKVDGYMPQSSSLVITPKTSNMHDGKTSAMVARASDSNGWSRGGTTASPAVEQTRNGELRAIVLSAYDLELREPPSFVSIEVCGQKVSTSPPIQRHKDRNSFKFGPSTRTGGSAASVGSFTTTSSLLSPSIGVSNEACIRAPLPKLYQATVQVKVIYLNNPFQNLVADFPLKQLNIGDPMWLILKLEKSADATTSNGALSTSKKNMSSSFDSDDQFNASNTIAPTVRVQFTLTGPYRAEVNAVLGLCNVWFQFIDKFESTFVSAYDNNLLLLRSGHDLIQHIHRNFELKYVLIPAVPVVAALVVASPIVVGFAVVTLPILLPVVSVILIVIFIVAFIACIIYFSTSSGREMISGAIGKPFATTLMSSKAGQKLVYDVGPRPSPIHIARIIMPGPNNIWGCLIVSLAIDFVGSLSYLIPILGEVTDIGWAPIQTILVMAMYETTSPNIMYLSFIEEILPFTDIVPTATLGWLKQFALPFVFGGKTTANGIHP